MVRTCCLFVVVALFCLYCTQTSGYALVVGTDGAGRRGGVGAGCSSAAASPSVVPHLQASVAPLPTLAGSSASPRTSSQLFCPCVISTVLQDYCTNESTGAPRSGCSAYTVLKKEFDDAYSSNRGPVQVLIHTPYLQKKCAAGQLGVSGGCCCWGPSPGRSPGPTGAGLLAMQPVAYAACCSCGVLLTRRVAYMSVCRS